MDDFSLVEAPQQLSKAPDTEFYLATVAGVSSTGAQLLFAGESSATSKYYKCLNSANVSTGDRVVVMKQSGTYIVIGKIGQGGGGGGGETTIITDISKIATAKSGYTLKTGTCIAVNGKIVSLVIGFTPTSTSSTSSAKNIATLKSDFRPAVRSDGSFWSTNGANNGAYVMPNGEVYIFGALSSTTITYSMLATYLLA